jgi:hypothetical protein
VVNKGTHLGEISPFDGEAVVTLIMPVGTLPPLGCEVPGIVVNYSVFVNVKGIVSHPLIENVSIPLLNAVQ